MTHTSVSASDSLPVCFRLFCAGPAVIVSFPTALSSPLSIKSVELSMTTVIHLLSDVVEEKPGLEVVFPA